MSGGSGRGNHVLLMQNVIAHGTKGEQRKEMCHYSGKTATGNKRAPPQKPYPANGLMRGDLATGKTAKTSSQTAHAFKAVEKTLLYNVVAI